MGTKGGGRSAGVMHPGIEDSSRTVLSDAIGSRFRSSSTRSFCSNFSSCLKWAKGVCNDKQEHLSVWTRVSPNDPGHCSHARCAQNALPQKVIDPFWR